MNVDINNLNETESTALIARIKQLNGEEASPIPYLKACVIELAAVFRTMPKEQISALIKARNELLFIRHHFVEIIENYVENRSLVAMLTDEETLQAGLTFAAIEGILEIFITLQESADTRLLELSPNIFEMEGGYHGTLN